MKTEMLSICGMRWYMATALECSNVVVDTMSWRGMVTYERNDAWGRMTYYRGAGHRLDGPAMESAEGHKWWCVDGKYHRVDGPAVERATGQKEWWVDGKLHRVDGPAVEYLDGYKVWYFNDKLHRVNGPAIEYNSGSKYW